MKIVNESIKEDQVGGTWACLIGCGSFCFLGGGATTYVAAVATAL